MTMREKFEEWWGGPPLSGEGEIRWETWQDAYRAGQEEMKEMAAAEAEGMDYSPDGAIARSIRALPTE